MGVPVELNDPPKFADGPALQDHKNFTLRVAPYSTKEGTATCGKNTWRIPTPNLETGILQAAKPTRTAIPET
jgi:hypothetical protein